MRVAQQPDWRRNLGTAAAIFALLTSVFSLSYTGSFRVDDEHVLAARAQSVSLWGEMNYPQVYGNDRVRELSKLPAELAPPHTVLEPLQTMAGAALFWVGSLLGIGGAQTAFTLNLYVTALTGVLVYLIVAHQGIGQKAAIFCALGYGLGTMAWPYSKTFFRDPLAAFMVAIAFLGWVMLSAPRKRSIWVPLLLLGGGTLGGMLTKHTATVLLPAFALSGFYLYFKRLVRFSTRVRCMVVLFLAIATLSTVVLALPDEGPLARFTTSYFGWVLDRFVTNFRPGALLALIGPLFSPTKSIFLLSPILILAPVGILRHWKRFRPYLMPAVLAVFFLIIVQALFYAELWAGTLIWGLRYMLPALPLMIAASAPLVNEAFQMRSHIPKIALGSLLIISVTIQLSAALVAWHVPYRIWAERGLDPYSAQAVWDPRLFQIPVYLRELAELSSWDAAWLRTMLIAPRALLLPIISLAFLAGCYLILKRLQSQRVNYGRAGSVALGAGLISIVMPFFPAASRLQADMATGGYRPELSAFLSGLDNRVAETDLIVIDSYGTPIWHFMMNEWTQNVPWYSLPFEIPGTNDVSSQKGSAPSLPATDLFERVGSEFTRVWYISSSDAPDSGLRREVRWLDRELQLVESRTYSGQSEVEVRLYVGDS